MAWAENCEVPVKDQIDVVVVGAGPGGMAAASASAVAGARTVLLEATTDVGGNAVLSTGYLAILDSDEQRDADLHDNEDQFLLDLRRAAMEEEAHNHPALLDEELARKFIRGTRETYEHLLELGVRFDRFVRRPRQHSVDRMLAVQDTTAFRSGFRERLEQTGVEIRYATRALELSRGTGGWRVRLQGESVEEWLDAAAVVLATGGYQGNAELRRRHQPGSMAARPYLGLATCRGDGHIMAASVGADMLNMGLIPSLVIVASGFVEDAIAVNSEGSRFHDETGPYDERVAAVLAQPDQRAYYVYDAPTAEARAHLIAQMPAPPVRAATLEKLAERINVSATALRRTVDLWNASLHDDARADPFDRGIFAEPRRGITTGPFHAVPLVVGAQFTGGGCRVTDQMTVVDLWGRPIPGLYAVGDCVGGINAGAAVGGIHIVSALTLGRVAGRAAALGATGDPTTLQPPGGFAGADRTSGATIDIVPIQGN